MGGLLRSRMSSFLGPLHLDHRTVGTLGLLGIEPPLTTLRKRERFQIFQNETMNFSVLLLILLLMMSVSLPTSPYSVRTFHAEAKYLIEYKRLQNLGFISSEILMMERIQN